MPSITRKTVPLFLCSLGSNVVGVSMALEGYQISAKSPSSVRDGRKGVAGWEVRTKYVTKPLQANTDTDPNTGKNRLSPIFRYSSRLHGSK